jgi:hypothetical protein
VSVTSSNGADNVTFDPSFDPLNLNGNVFVNTGLGLDGVQIDAGTSIAGSLSLIDTNTITFGSSAHAGSMVLNTSSEGAVTNSFTFNPSSTVSGNVSVVGGSGANTLLLDSTVNGNMQVVFGDGTNILTLGGTGLVGGSLSYNGGGGTVLSILDGFAVNGNANLSLGGGTNAYDLNHAFTVGGNMTLTTGNGDNNVGTFAGTVEGNLSFNLGNGANTVDFTGTVNGTTLSYTGGSGADNVTIEGTNFFALKVNLGAGSNTFTYGAGASVGSAYLDFGLGSAGDVYNDGGNIITWPQTIVNFTP